MRKAAMLGQSDKVLGECQQHQWNKIRGGTKEEYMYCVQCGLNYERYKEGKIVDDAREAHDDEVRPISFGVDLGKGESIAAVTKWKDGKIVEVKYD